MTFRVYIFTKNEIFLDAVTEYFHYFFWVFETFVGKSDCTVQWYHCSTNLYSRHAISYAINNHAKNNKTLIFLLAVMFMSNSAIAEMRRNVKLLMLLAILRLKSYILSRTRFFK